MNPLPGWVTRAGGPRILVSLVFLTAVLLRLVYLFGFSEPDYRTQDEVDYLAAATTLWEHGVFGYEPETPTAEIPVLYPIFLAPWVGVFGHGARVVLAVQTIIAGLAAVLSALTAFRIRGLLGAGIAGCFAATYVPSLLLSARFLTETLALFWLALGIYLLVRASGNDGARAVPRAVAIGVVFGLLALTRVVTIPLVLAAVAVMSFSAIRQSGARRAWLLPVLALLVAGAVYAPWPLRNRVSLGKDVILLDGEKDKVNIVAYYTAEGVAQGMSLTEARLWSRTFTGSGQTRPETDPATFFRHFTQRLGIMFGAHAVLGLPFPFAGSRLPVPVLVNAWHFAWCPLLLSGVLMCTVSGIRRLDPTRLGVVLIPLALLLVHALVHALPRYQLLVYSAWSAAAGVGWADLSSRFIRPGKASTTTLPPVDCHE